MYRPVGGASARSLPLLEVGDILLYAYFPWLPASDGGGRL